MADRAPWRRFARFCAVGGVGFLVDASVLQALVLAGGLGPLPARAVSFMVAVTATWFLNRKSTFAHAASPARSREWTRYVGTSTAGLAINFAVYTACILMSDQMAAWPVAALAVASGVAMVFNYHAARRFAYRGPGPTPARR